MPVENGFEKQLGLFAFFAFVQAKFATIHRIKVISVIEFAGGKGQHILVVEMFTQHIEMFFALKNAAAVKVIYSSHAHLLWALTIYEA